jgi:hypothetical protein
MVEGCRGISTKELERNLAQHRIDERILRYKLETYQKNISRFY